MPLDPAADEVALEVAARMILEAYLANPLAILADLRLDNAIDVRRYGEAALRFEEREHRQELAVAGDLVTVVANARDLARTGSLLSFELTSTIRAGLARGTLRLVRDGEGKARSSDQRARHEVRELRFVWRGELVHALRTLRDPPPVNRMNTRFPETRVHHAAMHDSLREAAGRVAMTRADARGTRPSWRPRTIGRLVQSTATSLGMPRWKRLIAVPPLRANATSSASSGRTRTSRVTRSV